MLWIFEPHFCKNIEYFSATLLCPTAKHGGHLVNHRKVWQRVSTQEVISPGWRSFSGILSWCWNALGMIIWWIIMSLMWRKLSTKKAHERQTMGSSTLVQSFSDCHWDKSHRGYIRVDVNTRWMHGNHFEMFYSIKWNLKWVLSKSVRNLLSLNLFLSRYP